MSIKIKSILIVLIVNIIVSNEIFASRHKPTVCHKNSDLYRIRSRELQQLVGADQLDRKK